MKNIFIFTLIAVINLSAETLFEVKDASDHTVLDVSTDGIRVMNYPDTIMVISSNAIQANISSSKGLSRSFSVATSTSKGSGIDIMRLTADSTRFWISDTGSGFGVASSSNLKTINTNLLEVTTSDAKLREGVAGDEYMDFSPENIFLGLNAGIATAVGSILGKNNVFLGNDAGMTNTSGYLNTFIGNEAGYLNNTGTRNVFIGYDAGYTNSDKDYNTFVGAFAGKYSTGFENTFVGCASGNMNSTGNDNSYFGFWTGAQNNTGSWNSMFGSAAGLCNVGGNRNTIMGFMAGVGSGVTNNSDNCIFGQKAGYTINTGSNNVIIGSESGYVNTSGSGNVFLGYKSGYNETGSNKLYIANSDTSTPLIKGTFPNTDLNFTANTVTVVHPLGETTNGLKIQTTYNSNADSWHLYQQTDDELGLYYNTNLRGSWNITSGAYTSVSDLKLKKNIEDVADVTDKVMLLQPKRYNFKNQNDNEKKYMGLIAQDVEKLFPEFVNFHKESDTYTIDYAGLSVVAIQAIKEQQAEIIKLSKRLDEIEKKLNMSK